MKHSRSRLKKALNAVGNTYDVVVLDCPPNISRLSENVFKVADRVAVPVIPTTLSERTYEQLIAFFDDQKFAKKKLLPFFSMVQRSKKLHKETMKRMRKQHKRFLKTAIPFCTDVEKMGLHRAPVLTYAKSSVAAGAYQDLWNELHKKL
jgi:chromosome partitioning protein